METKGRLIAGSHNRNEFVLINADEIARVSATWILFFSLSFQCFVDLNSLILENTVSFGIWSRFMAPFLHFELTHLPISNTFDCDNRICVKFRDPKWFLNGDSDSNGFSYFFFQCIFGRFLSILLMLNLLISLSW